MDSFSTYLRKAEEMLQAVDDSVAKHMKNEGSIGSLAISLSGVGGQQQDVAEREREEEWPSGDRARGGVMSRAAADESLVPGEIGRGQQPVLGAGESSTQSARSTKFELLQKKKRLEERRMELKERRKREEEVSVTAASESPKKADQDPAVVRVGVDKLGGEEEERMVESQEGGERENEHKDEHKDQRSTAENQVGENVPQQHDSREQTAMEYEDEQIDSDRLIRLVETLRRKNKELNKEVLHLEDELTQVESKTREYEESVAKLQARIRSTQSEAKESNDRANSLQRELDEATSTIESHEATIQSLRQSLERKERESATMTAERNVSETQLLASLRKDVDAAEMLAESERKAHTQSRKTFEARETQLEESVARAAEALAESQAKLDLYVGKLVESESRCTELEAQLLEAKKPATPSTSKSSQPILAEDTIRVQELELELSSALKDAANAKNELNTWQHDVVHLKDENERLKQRIAKLESSDASSLQRRVNELTSALYSKQTQIENLSAEKNALMMQSQSDGVRRRSAAVDKLFSGTDDGDNVVPMRSLGAVDKLAGWKAAEQWVERLARLLDAIAMQAVALIRMSPVFRLAFFAYLLGMHLFIYVLLYSWGTSTHSGAKIL